MPPVVYDSQRGIVTLQGDLPALLHGTAAQAPLLPARNQVPSRASVQCNQNGEAMSTAASCRPRALHCMLAIPCRCFFSEIHERKRGTNVFGVCKAMLLLSAQVCRHSLSMDTDEAKTVGFQHGGPGFVHICRSRWQRELMQLLLTMFR